MNIFVISLRSATERRTHIESQFIKINTRFDFFDAIDGRKELHPLFDKYNLKKRLSYKGYELTKGELGCFASHYLLWEKCLELGAPIVVIEDDAELEPCFLESVKCLQSLEEYEYLRLFVNGRYRSFSRIDKYFEHDVVEYKRGPGATRAYFLTPSAAKKFINSAQEWYLPVDDYMDQFWLNRVACRGLMPGLVKNETDFESSIGKLEKSNKVNRITRELYSIKCSILRAWYLYKYATKSVE